MNLIVNIINPKQKANKVENLSTSSKNTILKAIECNLKNPNKYVITLAEDVYGYEEKEANEDMVTLNEFLEEKGVVLPLPQKHKLANEVARRYKEITGANPRIVYRKDSKGRWQTKAKGYSKNDLYILEECLKNLIKNS